MKQFAGESVLGASSILKSDMPLEIDSLSRQLKDEITSITGALVKEELAMNMETERAEQMTMSRLFYKVPTGPLTTLNFTASPFEQISNAKKTKDKKKMKFSKVRKQKRMKFCEIPKNRGQSALISFGASEVLAIQVAEQYSAEIRAKYGLGPSLTCTERILEYEETMNAFSYLDHLREIEDDLIRAEPLLLKWEAAVIAKKKQFEREFGRKFDAGPKRPEAAKDEAKYQKENELKKRQSQDMISKLPMRERAELEIIDGTEHQVLTSELRWPWLPLLDETDPSREDVIRIGSKDLIKGIKPKPQDADAKPSEVILETRVVVEPEIFFKKPKFSLTCEVSTQVDIGVRMDEVDNIGESRWLAVLDYHRQCESLDAGDLRLKGRQKTEIKFRPQGIKNYYYISDPTLPEKLVVGAHYGDGFKVNGRINRYSEGQVLGEWRYPKIFEAGPGDKDGIILD